MVEKHLLSKSLEEIEKLDRETVEVTLLTRMASFKITLEEVFPTRELCNIGLKLRSIDKNIFLNEFLYNILADVPAYQDQMIMREHFILNHENSGSAELIPPRSVNLNNLFTT